MIFRGLHTSFILLFLFSSNIIFAQAENKTAIRGIVLDENDQAIPYAGVLLFKSADSSLVDGVSTNDKGEFELSAENGSYYIQIKFLSYQQKTISDVEVGGAEINLGNVLLLESENTLNTVTVEVDRPEMELKLDKRVFNVQQDISNAGQNAQDILDNIPSITVDAEGNVSLRGSGNVRILIDGKPSALLGMSGTDALRQIQGDMIDRVEVVTNPSARYDAEGEVGIINIILKKELEKGFNGSINARAGYPENFGGGFNVNLRLKKLNLFGGYNLGYSKGPGSGYTKQYYEGPDTSYRYEQERSHNRGGLSNNVSAGVDVHISKKASITLSSSYNKSDRNNTAGIIYSDYDLYDELTRTVTRNEDEIDFSHRLDVNLNFRQTFKNPEQLLTFDIQKNYSIDSEESDLIELSTDTTDAAIYQFTSSDEGSDNWLIQSDLVWPINKKEGKFETGFRISLKDEFNEFKKQDSLVSGWEVDDNYNNYLIYTENIYAAYVMAGNKSGKFSYQGGLRMEYSDVTTELVNTNQVNPRDYLNLFPSVHLSYEFKKKSFLQLSYSRRISRPGHHSLSPFFTFVDSRNYYSGNPNLNPEYTHSNELGHLKYWDKGSILTSVYYRYTAGIQERILLVDSLGYTKRFPVNLGNEHSYGLEISGSYEILKWLDLNGNLNFFRKTSSGEYEGVLYENETFGFNGRARLKFKAGRKFNAQLTYNYRAPASTSQGYSKSQYDFGASWAWEILKGNGTLSFNVRDIFNTRKRRSVVETITNTEHFYSDSEFQWRSRQMTLNFVYRINQKKDQRGGGMDGDFDGGGGEM